MNTMIIYMMPQLIKRKDFLHYNYLTNELDKKIENINYNQPIINNEMKNIIKFSA